MSFTPVAFLYAIPLLLVMAAIVAAIVLVVVRLSRNPAGATQGPTTPTVVTAALTPAAVPEVWWNAHVRREGHLDPFSGFGMLTLGDGVLTFVPDGAPRPAWSYPAPTFGIRANSVLANSDLTVDSSPTGPLKVTVSHENINRVSRNNFKSLRERDTSGEFIRSMRAAGATILT